VAGYLGGLPSTACVWVLELIVLAVVFEAYVW
jgi:hypothetical protein